MMDLEPNMVKLEFNPMLLLMVLQGPSSYTFIHFLEGIAVHNLHGILNDVFSLHLELVNLELPPWIDGHMQQPIVELGGSQAIGHQFHSTRCDGCHTSWVYGPCHPKIECKATPGTWCMSSPQCNPQVDCIDFAIVEPRTQIRARRTRRGTFLLKTFMRKILYWRFSSYTMMTTRLSLPLL